MHISSKVEFSGYKAASMSPFLMIEGIKRRTSLCFLYEGLPSSLLTYSNKPLMSTRITYLCKVLNSFVLFIHSRVLLMLLRQGLCPMKNVNAATGSALYFIWLCIPASQHQSWRTLYCLQFFGTYAAVSSLSRWMSDIILNLS